MSKEKAIRWFENIADECDKLTSGNVAHLKAQIKGMAIRSAEYLKKQEPASEDLEQAADRYGEQHITYKDDDGEWIDTTGPTTDAFKAGAQWQREQMMKDAVNAVVVKPDYEARGVVKSIRLQIDDDSIACAYDKGEKVKVIIIKE